MGFLPTKPPSEAPQFNLGPQPEPWRPEIRTDAASPLETFLAALRAMTPAQREMVVMELEARICLFCGTEDIECACWLEDKAEVPS